MYSNVYKPVPLIIKRKLCSIFNFEYKFMKDEVDKTDNNVPKACPVKAVSIHRIQI